MSNFYNKAACKAIVGYALLMPMAVVQAGGAFSSDSGSQPIQQKESGDIQKSEHGSSESASNLTTLDRIEGTTGSTEGTAAALKKIPSQKALALLLGKEEIASGENVQTLLNEGSHPKKKATRFKKTFKLPKKSSENVTGPQPRDPHQGNTLVRSYAEVAQQGSQVNLSQEESKK